MGSGVGTYLAKVVAWDFEVSDDDPIVTLTFYRSPRTPRNVRSLAAAPRLPDVRAALPPRGFTSPQPSFASGVASAITCDQALLVLV